MQSYENHVKIQFQPTRNSQTTI